MTTFLSVQTPVDGKVATLKSVNMEFQRDEDAVNPFKQGATVEKEKTSAGGVVEKVKGFFDPPKKEEDEQETPELSIKGKVKLGFETEDVAVDELMPASSVADAEKLVFEEEIFSNLSMPPVRHVPPQLMFAYTIARACGNVNTRCGRGPANTLVYNPVIQPEVDELEKKMAELTRLQISAEQKLNLVPTDNCPKDKVLVMYRGAEECDQPLIFVDNGESSGLLLNNTFADAEDYGKIIKEDAYNVQQQ